MVVLCLFFNRKNVTIASFSFFDQFGLVVLWCWVSGVVTSERMLGFGSGLLPSRQGFLSGVSQFFFGLCDFGLWVFGF